MKYVPPELSRKRAAAGLNESQFAEKLGISRALWFQLKRGKRFPSAKFLSAVMKVFPGLTVDVMAFLSRN